VGDRIAGQDVGVPGIQEPGDDEDKERDRVCRTRLAQGDLLVAVAVIP
jgi:hypothetical protein